MQQLPFGWHTLRRSLPLVVVRGTVSRNTLHFFRATEGNICNYLFLLGKSLWDVQVFRYHIRHVNLRQRL